MPAKPTAAKLKAQNSKARAPQQAPPPRLEDSVPSFPHLEVGDVGAHLGHDAHNLVAGHHGEGAAHTNTHTHSQVGKAGRQTGRQPRQQARHHQERQAHQPSSGTPAIIRNARHTSHHQAHQEAGVEERREGVPVPSTHALQCPLLPTAALCCPLATAAVYCCRVLLPASAAQPTCCPTLHGSGAGPSGRCRCREGQKGGRRWAHAGTNAESLGTGKLAEPQCAQSPSRSAQHRLRSRGGLWGGPGLLARQ